MIGSRAHGRTPKGTPTVTERWNAARARGDQTFDPGCPCVHGHECHRWTNNGICIECKRARDNAYNAAHKDEHRARTKRSVAGRREEVRAYQRTYYEANRSEAVRRAAEWGRRHPERVREHRRTTMLRHGDEYRRRARARHAANPEPKRAHNRKWKRANKHKVREADARRRAIEIGAQTGCRKAYAAFVRWARDVKSVPCYWCGVKTRPGKRHLDHVIPLVRGGKDAVENLCVSCPPCNLRKNAKMPEEFAGQAEIAF